nr:Endopeptidase La [Ipomoea batatas]
MFPAFCAKSIRNFSSITEAETDRSRLLLLLSLHSLIHRLPWLASHRCGRRNASKCRNLPFGFLDITHRFRSEYFGENERIAGKLGVFQKSKSGFQAVARPIEMFLSEQHSDSDVLARCAVAVVLDGSRAFVIEIQWLCVTYVSHLSKWYVTPHLELYRWKSITKTKEKRVCEGSLVVSVDGFNPTLAVAVDGVCQMLV